MRAVSNRRSERREDAGTRSGAVAARGVDPGEESPHTTRGESRRVRGRAEAAAQEEREAIVEAGRDGAAGGGVRRDGSTGEGRECYNVVAGGGFFWWRRVD